MASPTPPPSFSPNTQFLLHIPGPPCFDSDSEWTIDHVILTVDTLRAQLTMRLPVGLQKHGLPHETWDQWVVRLHMSFLEKFDATTSDRTILLTIACLYRAFAFGQHGAFSVNSEFYIAFTHGFVELARSAMGQCVKRDLALYVIDMSVLVPNSTFEEASASLRTHLYPDPITPDLSDEGAVPEDMVSSPPSPSITAATELTDASADDSGYESFDSVPSLLTVVDSSDEYNSDSSEEPSSDEEEEALMREGFVVDENEDDVSDLDL